MVEMAFTSMQKLIDILVVITDSSHIHMSKSSLWFKVKVRIRDETNKCNQFSNLFPYKETEDSLGKILAQDIEKR